MNMIVVKSPRLLPASETFVRKGVYGWAATTYVELAGDRSLKVTTMKRSSGALVSQACVVRKENGFDVYVPYQDYCSMVIADSPPRVTSKVVETQQAEALGRTKLFDVLCSVAKRYGVDVIPEDYREEYRCFLPASA